MTRLTRPLQARSTAAPVALRCLALLALAAVGCSDAPTVPLTTEASALGPSLDRDGRPDRDRADIRVSPSGDQSGATDADAIEGALSAARRGDVIELAAGTFYINRTLVAKTGFSGTLRGRGADRTTILGVGTASAPFGNAPIRDPGGPDVVEGSAFVYFPEPSRRLVVSDLTAALPDGFATEVNFGDATDLVGFFIVQLGAAPCDTRFEDLRLQGTESRDDLFLIHQPLFGVTVSGVGDGFPVFSSGGRHEVRDSEFSKIGFEATIHQLFKRARIEVTDNKFSDVKQVMARWLDDANVAITGNEIQSATFGAIVVTQEGVEVPGRRRSDVVIRGNRISVRGFLGIEIGAIPEATRPDFRLSIERNTIVQAGPDPSFFGFPNLAGIGLFDGQEDAVVRNNTVTGEASFGILALGVNESYFIRNNLQGFTPVLFGDLPAAHLALIESNRNRVVGNRHGTVLDLGTGNVIVADREEDDDDDANRAKLGASFSIGTPLDRSSAARIRAAQQKRRDLIAARRLGRGDAKAANLYLGNRP